MPIVRTDHFSEANLFLDDIRYRPIECECGFKGIMTYSFSSYSWECPECHKVFLTDEDVLFLLANPSKK